MFGLLSGSVPPGGFVLRLADLPIIGDERPAALAAGAGGQDGPSVLGGKIRLAGSGQNGQRGYQIVVLR
jgi:hypothetical protein